MHDETLICFLRKIGGLDAVDEALGRATEMGSLYCLSTD